MKKKGFVWISAVLYIALGVVAISLVLMSGLPLINKMKDRNTIIQTKELLHVIDNNIQQVRSEGPGSRRYLDTVIIKGGSLAIYDYDYIGDEGQNEFLWKMDTKAMMMEPCEIDTCDTCSYIDKEGSVETCLEKTVVKDEYVAFVRLKYSDIGLELADGSEYTAGSTLTGRYAISIENSDDYIYLDVI